MIKVCPASGEDRAKILDYCEGHKAHVVNERDVDDCVVIEMDRDSAQGAALLTGLKTNAKAKFKDKSAMKESLLQELIALYEASKIKLTEVDLHEAKTHASESEVKRLSAKHILDAADRCIDGDDVTSLHKSKALQVVEVTSDDDGNPVAVLEAWYQRNRWLAHVTFGPDLEAMRVHVEKDSTAFKR